jgi:hypothetical protein
VGGIFLAIAFLNDILLDGSWIMTGFFCALCALVSLVLIAIGVCRHLAFMRRLALWLVLLVVAIANSWVQTAVAQHNAARVIHACDAYRAAHGEYPKQLADLVPRFLAKVPSARYCLRDNGFFYASVSPNATLSWTYRPPFGRMVYRFDVAQWSFYD